MNNKVIAVGVVAVLAVTALCGALVLNQSNNGGSSSVDLEGKWSLTYVESVSLLKDGKPIMDADDCEIRSNGVDPKINNVVIEFTSVNNNFFRGKVGDTEIHGTVTGGSSFAYQTSMTSKHDGQPHLVVVRGVAHKDHLSLSFNQYSFESGKLKYLCHAGYALFVPEGGKLVSPRIDRVDYNIEMEKVDSIMHQASDFAKEGREKGKGIDLQSSLEYVKSRSMISLFSMPGPSGKGLMVLTSLGMTQRGAANGIVGANLSSDYQGEVHAYCLQGDSVMADGSLTVTAFHVGPGKPVYIAYKFNVPFESGTLPGLEHIAKTYRGTIYSWETDDEPTVYEDKIKEFTVVGDTLYAIETDTDGTVYTWIGHMYGRHVKFMVSSDRVTGIISGGVSESGDLVLSGILQGKDFERVYQYRLSPEE